jgi:hypothetical protein
MTWTQRARPIPPDGRMIRQHVLTGDGWPCRIRLKSVGTGMANEVDHIEVSGSDAGHNLGAACTPCDRARSTAQGREAGNAMRRAATLPQERPPASRSRVTSERAPRRFVAPNLRATAAPGPHSRPRVRRRRGGAAGEGRCT